MSLSTSFIVCMIKSINRNTAAGTRMYDKNITRYTANITMIVIPILCKKPIRKPVGG